MAVISGPDYRLVTDEVGAAYTEALEVKDYLFEAVYRIVLLQVIIPEVDLLSEYWDSYQVNSPIYSSSVNFMGSVKTMQSHVLQRGGYATIDAYLLATGTQVCQSWATLSAAAGYPISNAYIY